MIRADDTIPDELSAKCLEWWEPGTGFHGPILDDAPVADAGHVHMDEAPLVKSVKSRFLDFAAPLEHDDDALLCDDDCVSDEEHLPKVVPDHVAEATPAAVPEVQAMFGA